MQKYTNKMLRREILKTIGCIPFSRFRLEAVLDALKKTGFDDLNHDSLMAQFKYLEGKVFVKIEKTKHFMDGEEFINVCIKAEGIDLLEGNRSDIGIDDA
jgi:hypothetical protein